MNNKGFTLIEVMIALAIIGIIAAVAIPAYQLYSARSQLSEAISLSRGLQTQIAETAMSGADIDELDSGSNGLPAASDVSGTYVSQVVVVDGVLTATIGKKASRFISGQTLTIQPVTQPGSSGIKWDCSFSGESQYAPSTCR